MLCASLRVVNSVSVGTSSAADASSVVDLVSTTRGLRLPRLTTVQRDAVSSPQAGLMIFNTTTALINFYDGSLWVEIDTITSSDSANSTSYTETFTNSTLVAGVLTVTHNMNQRPVSVQIFDNNFRAVIPDEITLTSLDVATVDLTSFGVISGTWSVIVVS